MLGFNAASVTQGLGRQAVCMIPLVHNRVHGAGFVHGGRGVRLVLPMLLLTVAQAMFLPAAFRHGLAGGCMGPRCVCMRRCR